MKFAVDRLEGDFAVCIADTGEGREFVFSLPAQLFPAPPREGDIYVLTLEHDPTCRDRRVERVKNRLSRLFDKDKSGKSEKGEEKHED